MFDIGFWELTVIGVIALLVVGPERLPAMARTLGLWVGRIRRYVSHVRDDIEREIQAEELRDLMKESRNLNTIGESLSEASQVLNEVKRDIESVDHEVFSGDEEKGQAPTPGPDSERPSAIDSATTGVGDAVSGGDAGGRAGQNEADSSAAPDQIQSDERRSG
ncbi:MAG TPA: Sec-independent protein translocase protein TatB [Gammaproteobacteria bacterium]